MSDTTVVGVMPGESSLVSELNGLLAAGRVPEKDKGFAQSLIDYFKDTKRLSMRQAFFVRQLITRATPERHTEVIGDFSGVYTMFKKAGETLKHPKVRLNVELADETSEIVLYLAGERSRVPGVVNVVLHSQRAGEVWCGRLGKDGVWAASHRVPAEYQQPIRDLLLALSQNPEAVAANYGRVVGKCCFCNSGLDDARSLAVGYGPVCAKRYGLSWGSSKKKKEAK